MTRLPKLASPDHLPPWMLAAAIGGRIQAASPYVTSNRLFQTGEGRGAELFIDFSSQHFAAGASDIGLIESLADRGIQLFHVKNLHAKVVLIDSKFFSIGSQNLTYGGLNNIEASFVSGGDTPTTEVVRFFRNLKRRSLPISKEDILEMKAHVNGLREEFQRLSVEATRIDGEVEAARLARDQKRRVEKASLKALADAALRQTAMPRAVEDARRLFERVPSSRKIKARVRKLTNSRGYRGLFTTSTRSLVPVDRMDHFFNLIWDKGEMPREFSRYPMLDLDTGRLAYIRLAGKRISYFENNLIPGETFSFGNVSYRAHIDLEWEAAELKFRNLSVKLVGDEPSVGEIGSVDFAFSGRRLTQVSLRVAQTPGQDGAALNERQIERTLRSKALRDYVADWLTKNFKYEKRLTGPDAAQYLGSDASVTYEVATVPFNDALFFAVRKC